MLTPLIFSNQMKKKDNDRGHVSFKMYFGNKTSPMLGADKKSSKLHPMIKNNPKVWLWSAIGFSAGAGVTLIGGIAVSASFGYIWVSTTTLADFPVFVGLAGAMGMFWSLFGVSAIGAALFWVFYALASSKKTSLKIDDKSLSFAIPLKL
jgi:hypothetical protein